MNSPTSPDLRAPQFAALPEEELFNLRSAVATVLDYWALAVSFLVAGALFGLFKGWVTPPQYEASALIEIEKNSSGFAVGPEMLGASSYWLPDTTSAQIEILKSRSILGAAAEELSLAINATPIYLGAIGAAIARSHRGAGLASDPWYIPLSGKYAWGGEKIDVTSLRLPDNLQEMVLTVVAGDAGAYTVHAGEGMNAAGRVGEELRIPLGADGEVVLTIAALTARPGTEFAVARMRIKDAADSLRGRLRITERGSKGAFQGTGILELSVRSSSPKQASDTANAIATTYLRQNIERLSQGAERKLEFLNAQLPKLQAEVEAAEQALLEQRSRSGPYQLSEGAKSILESLTSLEREISELELQRTELAQTLTPEHPALAAVVRKANQLRGERDRVNTKIAALPDAEARLLQLSRDSKVASELYVLLLNQAQELRLAKAGTIGNVRIVDTALPVNHRVEPRARWLLLSWSGIGLVAGLTAVFLRKHLNVKLNWAEDAERKIGIPVYATIPYSDKQGSLDKSEKGVSLLAETDPKDIAVESLRSLRASLHFAMMDAKRNLAVITGSTPNVGKSFVAANLARLMADTGKKVLLIDADMRKGRMHKMFGIERSPGLSEGIVGQADFKQIRYRGGLDNFWVIPTGKLPPNPAELLGSDRFIELVEGACKDFDLVIVDTPPILNLADTVLVAKSAGALFVTIRGGISTVPDVQDCVQRFAKNGIKVDGLIFNGLRPSVGSYVHPQYYHYRYSYGRYRYGQKQ
ncbi:MAG TPA: polysaccharide biosynthesis tyrosine autokinase [Verrucomicrobiae bacterium]|nr:polysaccharide biosynthesis tyrosine autokinase [Verrucomicrobiae bacterium]